MRDVADTASRELRPFRHPPFRRLALTQVAHAAGDGLVTVALADSLFFAVPIGEAREARFSVLAGGLRVVTGGDGQEPPGVTR